METIKPASVAGAAFLMQGSLLVIIFFGVGWYREARHLGNSVKAVAFGLGLILAILTISILGLSEDYYRIWGAMMGDLQLPTIGRSAAMLCVFLSDIVVTIILISLTGGTRASPFTSVLFLIPSLAIFLRESPAKFLTYAAIVGAYYWLSCRASYTDSTRLSYGIDDGVAAHRVVNIGCLILATLTGYITRPVPI
jgi:hypothetical protein